jgi:hypothetical protein
VDARSTGEKDDDDDDADDPAAAGDKAPVAAAAAAVTERAAPPAALGETSDTAVVVAAVAVAVVAALAKFDTDERELPRPWSRENSDASQSLALASRSTAATIASRSVPPDAAERAARVAHAHCSAMSCSAAANVGCQFEKYESRKNQCRDGAFYIFSFDTLQRNHLLILCEKYNH